MMVKIGLANLIFFMVFMNLPFSGTGQVMDDFSDGNFSLNPLWTGDSLQFEVNSSKQLHLKSSGTDTSCLVTHNILMDSTEWGFFVKCSFSPSGSNYARFYLCSDQQNLKGPLNGYYLQLGESGSADGIELFRQCGTESFSVCRGPDSMLATSFALRIKVLRKSNGLFAIYADTMGGLNFTLYASGYDTLVQSTENVGIYCRYTTSNSTKFYFDDIVLRHIFLDQQPPVLQSLKVIDQQSAEIQFNEPVNFNNATNPSNYLVDKGVGHPISCTIDTASGNVVSLQFSPGFPEDVFCKLTASGIQDISGNSMDSATVQFCYHRVKQHDILINEIMADPEPQLGLPPFEYVELYNRTTFPISLTDWTLQTGTSKKVFPEVRIYPHSFLITGSENAHLFFSNYGSFIGFPSFSLANEGTDIWLSDEEGRLISNVSYSSDWYKNPVKEDGGYSLEQIDPENPCGGESNWTASNDPRGGSPGKMNSVYAVNPDETAPDLAKVVVVETNSIRLTFTEQVDSSTLLNPSTYKIDQNIGNPILVSPVGKGYTCVDLLLGKYLHVNTIYSLSITDTIKDCAGNQLSTEFEIPFAIPEQPNPGDLLINEILFDPGSAAAEFVELYNNSNKVLDLGSMVIASRDTVSDTLTDINSLSDGRLIFPDEYLVISSDPDKVKNSYNTLNPRGFEKLSTMPQLTNTADIIVIADKNLQILDEVAYKESWHHPLLNSTTGVSLERISFSAPSSDAKNWHSAAGTVGYATPAYKNSQVPAIDSSGLELVIQPDVFSPDNDGFKDNLSIQFSLKQPDYQANILIFNDNGQRVRTLVNNELCGTAGLFSWDGCDDLRRVCHPGYYIVFFQLINPAGIVKTYKQAVALVIL